MKTVIDITLLIVLALCTWGGYKKGLIGSIAAMLAIVVAIFGAKLLSSAYASEVIPALEPFVDGYVSSQDTRNKLLDKLGYGESDKSLDDILTEDPSLRYDYAYECVLSLGLYTDRAEELAYRSVSFADSSGNDMTDSITAVLCDTVTYEGCLVLAFLMILILITAVGNLFNLSLRIPNMESVDEIGGAVFGFLKGMVYCVLLSWVLSYFGIVIGKATMGGTVLGRFFLSFRFIIDTLI